MTKRVRLLVSASAAAICASVAAPALAQTNIVDEITIFAQKRTENIQDVPIAVSAYNSALIEASGITDIRELVSLSPSLTVAASQSEAAGVNARIRGVGTTGDNPGLESSVGVFIDGIYRSRNSIALNDLGEIESIEVLRGPQGTLFGRNVSAGAINIVTKAPEYEFGGFIEGTYGNFGNKRIAGGLTGPLAGDVAAARIFAMYEERDGLFSDAITGQEFNTRDRYLVRGQLLFEPTDTLSVKIIGDYSERDEDCCAAAVRVAGPTAAIANLTGLGNIVTPPQPFERFTTTNIGYQQDVEEYGVSGEARWSGELFNVTALLGFRDWEVRRSQDVDFTDIDIAIRPEDGFVNDFQTFTGEIRADGSWGAIDWLAGFFYSDEEIGLTDQITVGSEFEPWADILVNAANNGAGIPGFTTFANMTGIPSGFVFAGAAEDDVWNVDSQSWALFTHNVINLGDRAKVILGLRYTDEQKDLTATTSSSNNGCLATVSALGTTFPTQVLGALAAQTGLNPAVPAELAQLQALTTSTIAAAAPTIAGLACIANINPGSALGIPGTDGTFSDTRNEDEFTGTAKVSFNLTQDILLYGGYSRGYKAGGYNLDRFGFDNPLLAFLTGAPATFGVENLEFDEETVDAYEIGFKATLFDGAASLNVAAFMQDFENFQLNTFNGVGFIVENISEVDSDGVEVEFLASPTDGLLLQGGVTYADTRYGEANSTIRSSDGRTLDGRRITLAPLWVATGAVSYRREIPNTNMEGFFHFDTRFDSGSNTGSDLDPEKLQNDFYVVNGKIGVATLDNGIEVEVWGRNLFDRDYTQIAFDLFAQSGSFGAFLGEPRTYGVTVRGRF